MSDNTNMWRMDPECFLWILVNNKVDLLWLVFGKRDFLTKNAFCLAMTCRILYKTIKACLKKENMRMITTIDSLAFYPSRLE